jgi:tetratricopeptide (TPR) repeat protein
MAKLQKHPHVPADPRLLEQLMATALRHHQTGHLHEAEALYRQVLQVVPDEPGVLHLAGMVACQQGRHEDGIPLLRKAIARNPSAEYHVTLGNALKESGKLEPAAKQYREALRLNPNLPEVHNNLGTVLREQGDTEAAIVAYRKTLASSPGFAQAHFNLGSTLLDAGQAEEAVASLEEAVALLPNYVDALINLGSAYNEQGQFEKAVPPLLRALESDPASVAAHRNLGHSLDELGRHDRAVPHYREALRLGADSADLRTRLANCLRETDQFAEALVQAEQALALDPEYAPALVAVGDVFKNQGHHDDALAAYRRALAIAPRLPGAYVSLAAVKRFGPEDEDLRRMEALVESLDEQVNSLPGLHFALGKAYGDCKDYERSFRHYAEGNRLRRAKIDYDAGQRSRLVDELAAVFTPELFAERAGLGSESERPVFILGMPRSGTTLTEQIVSSHPQAVGAGELTDFTRMTGALQTFLQDPDPYPRCITRITEKVARDFQQVYLERLGRDAGEETVRVTDKLPGNYLHLGLIALLFPRAPVIHVRRHPIDNCLSIFFQSFHDTHGYAFDLRELGLHYQDYERLMAHWRRVIPNPLLEFRYEDLVEDQEAISRRLIAFCGLPWDDACLRFHETDRPVHTASHWQVRQPIYRSSVERWRRYDEYLSPLKEGLGWSEE